LKKLSFILSVLSSVGAYTFRTISHQLLDVIYDILSLAYNSLSTISTISIGAGNTELSQVE
jgi:hypothetical protein